jgi:DNA helicase-2/ATP-dependent DNA helicase PcrA
MSFYADLHVHSRYSRATSQDAGLETYAQWAHRKGIAVVGTGDFTHPAWRREIGEKLVPAEPGLFRLRTDLESAVEAGVPQACRAPATAPVRFILSVEISTIYKKADHTRKVHHVVFAPDLDKADRFAGRLSRIGNLGSDGRPILGLDSRHLLEIALQSGEGCFLIPAHIWTPWFSVLGSRSGFDAVEDCYGDLADHVFALETGLSSDPPMNWRLSALDRYRLVSNSDAHSPSKLGREACLFEGAMDYFAMRQALATGSGYGGTVEFFPEEGKYHMDGHRKCGVRLTPQETRENKGRCPACGKPVTVGVMNRVEELADRSEGSRPEGARTFRSFIPLAEMLAETMGVGPDARKVQEAHERLLARLGPELFILGEAKPEDIDRKGSPRLAEAILRMRGGRVIREAGYDGEYGVIRLFQPDELSRGRDTSWLLDVPAPTPTTAPIRDESVPVRYSEGDREAAKKLSAQVRETAHYRCPDGPGILGSLDPEQRAAAEVTEGPLLIIAGPGTGKTRTLTHRLAHLIADLHAPPEQCLAVTFTNRAAGEMIGRLRTLVPAVADRVPVMTFHSLGHRILREHGGRLGLPLSFRVADEAAVLEVLKATRRVGEREAARLLRRISGFTRRGCGNRELPTSADADPNVAAAFDAYERAMRARGLVDFDDLVRLPADLLESHPEVAAAYRERYPWVSVDEYQDVDEHEYRLIRLLVPAGGNLCAIGDPDQAIYGFRGSDVRFFQRFSEDFPNARVARLTRNYRSGRMIVNASLQLITPTSLVEGRKLEPLVQDATRIVIHEAPTDRAEAEFVVHTIEQLIGGSTFFSMDSRRVEAGDGDSFSFADFAVLYRTEAQADALCEALDRSGMPYQRRSHARLSESPVAATLVSRMQNLTEEPDMKKRLTVAMTGLAEEPARREALRMAPALRSLADRSRNMEEFVSELAMAFDVDAWDPRADAISLLTLHASKGLEFAVVFIVGCEDGIVPLRWPDSQDADAEEERRLFFVGMTRAGRRLLLSRARRRVWMGTLRDMAPSPFLRDMEEQWLEHRRAPAGAVRSREEQLNLL